LDTHIRVAPALSLSSCTCPLSMRTRTHVRLATRTTSRYGALMSAVMLCTAAIHGRAGVDTALLGAAARAAVGTGVAVLRRTGLTSMAAPGMGGSVPGGSAWIAGGRRVSKGE